MPKAIKKKITRKTASTETEVQEKLSSIKDTLRERQSTAMKIFVGILIIMIALVSVLVYSYTSAKKAKLLEYEAYRIYYSSPQIQSADKTDQYKKALDAFKKAYDTKKSPRSLFYIAACYYELGQYDDALRTLKDFVQRYSGDEQFIPLAYQKMAMTYVRKGDTNEAKKILETLYNLKGDIYKDFALMEHARLLEKEGKTDEARKKYEELIRKFPNSPFMDEAKAKTSDKKEG